MSSEVLLFNVFLFSFPIKKKEKNPPPLESLFASDAVTEFQRCCVSYFHSLLLYYCCVQLLYHMRTVLWLL